MGWCCLVGVVGLVLLQFPVLDWVDSARPAPAALSQSAGRGGTAPLTCETCWRWAGFNEEVDSETGEINLSSAAAEN